MEFLLDDDVVFLNHGSFGACPRVVHDEYQRLQRRLETEPVRFLQRELPGLLADARADLAAFIGADRDEVVFVSNPTYAVNEIARTPLLEAGDEVLTTNHEYGACRNAWQFASERVGFDVVEASVPVTLDDCSFVDLFWQSVTERTKIIFLSHITSATALSFPVAKICERARANGILSVIDGAHVPGQMPLDVEAIGADFYVGTCHKWLCAPKGASFMWARRDVQHLIEPLVVGWSWGDHRSIDTGHDFADYHAWLGTDDPSAYLTVPTAIRFQEDNDWSLVQARCHDLAVEAIELASTVDGVARVHRDELFAQMALLELGQPGTGNRADAAGLQQRLYDEYRVQAPIGVWVDPASVTRTFLRLSFQAYNTGDDVAALVHALEAMSPAWAPSQ